jgi:hypothetical protein
VILIGYYCIVIAAAGNDGSEGAFYISSPGSGLDIVAVASIDNIYNLQQSVVSEEKTEYRMLTNVCLLIKPFLTVFLFSFFFSIFTI